MPYFECNLPDKAPAYIHASHAESMAELFQKVRERTEKLEQARDWVKDQMTAATFSEYAKGLFDTRRERFDEMTAMELADYALMVHTPGYKAKERLEWPNATVLCDSAFLTTKEWEAIRHLGIGGSDAAVVQNGSPYRTSYALYHDKVWTPKANTADDGKAAIFERGHAMEDKVIAAFCQQTGGERVPETRMFQSKRYPACIADVDAIIRLPNGNLYIFEAKTTIAANYKAWEGGKIPSHYLPQCRQYAAVLNDPRILGTFIGCLFTVDYTSAQGMYLGSDADVGKFVCRSVPRDEQEEDFYLGCNQQFFDEHIAAGNEPAFKGNAEVNKTVLAEIYGPADPDKEPIALPPDATDIILDYLDFQARKKTLDDKSKALKEAMDSLSVQLIAELGPAVEGRLPVPDSPENEYYEVKYTPRKSTKVDCELMEAVFPEAYQRCVQIDPCGSRTFSIKVKKPKPEPKRTRRKKTA